MLQFHAILAQCPHDWGTTIHFSINPDISGQYGKLSEIYFNIPLFFNCREKVLNFIKNLSRVRNNFRCIASHNYAQVEVQNTKHKKILPHPASSEILNMFQRWHLKKYLLGKYWTLLIRCLVSQTIF